MCDYTIDNIVDKTPSNTPEGEISNRLMPEEYLQDDLSYSCRRDNHNGDKCLIHKPIDEKDTNKVTKKVLSEIRSGNKDFVGIKSKELTLDKIDEIEDDLYFNNGDLGLVTMYDSSVNALVDFSSSNFRRFNSDQDGTLYLEKLDGDGEVMMKDVTCESVDMVDIRPQPEKKYQYPDDSSIVQLKFDFLSSEAKSIKIVRCNTSKITVKGSDCSVDELRMRNVLAASINVTYSKIGYAIVNTVTAKLFKFNKATFSRVLISNVNTDHFEVSQSNYEDLIVLAGYIPGVDYMTDCDTVIDSGLELIGGDLRTQGSIYMLDSMEIDSKINVDIDEQNMEKVDEEYMDNIDGDSILHRIECDTLYVERSVHQTASGKQKSNNEVQRSDVAEIIQKEVQSYIENHIDPDLQTIIENTVEDVAEKEIREMERNRILEQYEGSLSDDVKKDLRNEFIQKEEIDELKTKVSKKVNSVVSTEIKNIMDDEYND